MICTGLQAQQPETAGGKAKPIKAREVKKAEKAAEVKAAEEVRDEIYDEVDEMPVYKIGNKAFYSLMRQNFEALGRGVCGQNNDLILLLEEMVQSGIWLCWTIRVKKSRVKDADRICRIGDQVGSRKRLFLQGCKYLSIYSGKN